MVCRPGAEQVVSFLYFRCSSSDERTFIVLAGVLVWPVKAWEKAETCVRVS